MAILRGEEARQWIAQNPRKGYKVLTTGEVVQDKPSAIMSILQGITNPFRMGAGIAHDFVTTIGQLGRMAKGDTSTPETRPLWWLTEEENRKLREDPLRAGLKAGAGVAAYGVPVGGGAASSALGRVGTAAGRGALSSGMSGFALSEDDEELQGALTGGALGGVLGGGLQAGKEAIGAISRARVPKLKGVGEGLETPVGRPSATKGGINTYGKAKKLSQDMEKTLKENIDLIKETNPQLYQRYKSGLISQTEKTLALEEMANIATERAGYMRDSSVSKIDVTDLQKKILNSEWMKKNPTAKRELMRNGFFEEISQLGEPTKASDGRLARYATKGELFEFLKNNVDEEINYARNQMLPKPKLERAYRHVQRLLRNELERGASDKYIKYNRIYQTFADARDTGYLARISNDELGRTFGLRGGAVKIPVVGDVLDSPEVKMEIGRIKNLAGRAMQSSGLGRIERGVERGLQSGGGGLASILGLGQRAIPAIPGAIQQGGYQGVEPVQGSGGDSYQPQLDQLALAQAVINGDLSVTEAKFLMDLLGEKTSSTKLTKDQANAQAALQSLNILEQILSSDSAALPLSYLPFQGFNRNAQVLEQASLNIEDVIARLRTGAVINDEEAARYRKMIPRITDTTEAKMMKIQQLRNIFESILNRNQSQDQSALLQLLGQY